MWDTKILNPDPRPKPNRRKLGRVPTFRPAYVGPKRRAKPLTAFCSAYPESVVTHFSQSIARRIPPATTVVLILALLVTQAASFRLRRAVSPASGKPAKRCHDPLHAMHSASRRGKAPTSPPTATSFCVTDLLATGHEKNLVQPNHRCKHPCHQILPHPIHAARTPAFFPGAKYRRLTRNLSLLFRNLVPSSSFLL